MRILRLQLTLYDEHCSGEAEEVVARAVDQGWGPWFEALAEAPQIRLALHPSGACLAFMEHHRPFLLQRLVELLGRRQVELISGAWHGAVLHTLPNRDAVAQLLLYERRARAALGIQPKGMWLARGAWDPGLVRIAGVANLDYALVDAELIRAAGLGPGPLAAWYATERVGSGLGLLPLDRGLAAMIPSCSPSLVISELGARAETGWRFLSSAVSIDAFSNGKARNQRAFGGRVPWVASFLRLLGSQSAWLKTALPRPLVARAPCGGRVYPPSGTPVCTGRAALSPEGGRALEGAGRVALEGRQSGVPGPIGPPWEAFLARYDESDRLHKRMLRASDAWQRMRQHVKEGAPAELVSRLELARDHLLSAQAAPCYDTVVGGGALSGSLRHHAWSALAETERLVHDAFNELDRCHVEQVDLDGDGANELAIRTPALRAVVRPARGAALSELVVWGLGSIGNVFSRREEWWHALLGDPPSAVALVGQEEPSYEIEEDPTNEDGSTDVGVIPIPAPEPPQLAVADSERLRWTDRHRRALFQDHFFGPHLSLEGLRRDQAQQTGDFLDADYQLQRFGPDEWGDVVGAFTREGVIRDGPGERLLRLEKQYRFKPQSPEFEVEYALSNRAHEPIRTTLGVELNLNLDSGRGSRRRLRLGTRPAASVDAAGDVPEVARVAWELGDLGRRVVIELSPAARVLYHPLEVPMVEGDSVVNAFQGTALMLCWPMELWGHEIRKIRILVKVEAG